MPIDPHKMLKAACAKMREAEDAFERARDAKRAAKTLNEFATAQTAVDAAMKNFNAQQRSLQKTRDKVSQMDIFPADVGFPEYGRRF